MYLSNKKGHVEFPRVRIPLVFREVRKTYVVMWTNCWLLFTEVEGLLNFHGISAQYGCAKSYLIISEITKYSWMEYTIPAKSLF
jgi:hypothetical protein